MISKHDRVAIAGPKSSRRLFLGGLGAFAFSGPASARTPRLYQAPRPLLSPPIVAHRGKTQHLKDFAGTPLVLNIWATWCPPCRTEMPSLARLNTRLRGSRTRVLPVCIDQGGLGGARDFFRSAHIDDLPLYWCDPLRAGLAFAFFGLPTTLLVDGSGREAGRVQGPLIWDSDDVLAVVEALR